MDYRNIFSYSTESYGFVSSNNVCFSKLTKNAWVKVYEDNENCHQFYKSVGENKLYYEKVFNGEIIDGVTIDLDYYNKWFLRKSRMIATGKFWENYHLNYTDFTNDCFERLTA